MKCNFEVLAFAGRAWTAHVDYMFFRNNRSNEGKLSSALAAAADSVAYCCQCSWANVTDGADREISMNAGLGLSAASAAPGDALEWICCGHS
jgi:recombinational DNA repair protein RecR